MFRLNGINGYEEKNSSTSSLYRDAKDIENKYLMADEIVVYMEWSRGEKEAAVVAANIECSYIELVIKMTKEKEKQAAAKKKIRKKEAKLGEMTHNVT